jgi:hypothetical protein
MTDRDATPAQTYVSEQQNTIAVLERLRNSYQAGPLTGVDQAVLMAVEITLENAMNQHGQL